MIKIFIYSFIIIAGLNAILRTFSREYVTSLGKSVFDISPLQGKVYARQANIFEIILCYLINTLGALKNIMIYGLAGIITLIAYLIGIIF